MRRSIHSFIEFFYFDFFKFIPFRTFKYMACGGTTVLVDMVVFNLLNYIVFKQQNVAILTHTLKPHVASQILSFIVSFPIGFLFNKYIVFTESELRGRVQLFRYGLTALGSFLLSLFFIKLFIDIFHFYALPSKILTTLMVIIFSFFAQQYFSFKVKTIDSKQ